MEATTMHDLTIRNATIYDGSGADAFVGDIAIDADRIADVGDVGAGSDEIDATGRALCPGFIDVIRMTTSPQCCTPIWRSSCWAA
jgi:N-acyl-D-amino-acid deacylase